MKLLNQVDTDTNCQMEGHQFNIMASPIAFNILSSKLYANPVLAIVREILTNAYDSHKAAKKLNVPIKVHFPDYLDKNFSIRDYGIGLCKEDVMEMYTTFFNSTKANTNDFTGCFGLGSKTPFSYAPAFSVNSFWNGTKYYFAAVKKDGYPSIYCTREEPTDESNGLEVIIPTDNDVDFFQETTEYLQYMSEIIIDSNKDISRKPPVFELGNITLYEGKQSYYGNNYNKVLIKQGQNVYPSIDFINLGGYQFKDVKFITKMLKKNIIVINVPIGTLDITPSREALSQDQSNVDKINAYLLKTEEELKTLIMSKADVVKSLNNEIYDQVISEKYLDPTDASISSANSSINSDRVIRVFNCYVDYITEEGRSRTNTINGNAKYIIISDKYFNSKDIIKMKNTLINHNEDINEVYVISPYSNSDLLRFVKRMKNLFWILNEIEEYDFNFELYNLNQFYRKYTNHKRQRDKANKPNYCERNIMYSTEKMPLWRFDTRLSLSDKLYDSQKIGTLHERLNPDNTLILQKNMSNNELFHLLNLFLHKIRDTNGNNFMLEFLQGKGLDIFMNKQKDELGQEQVSNLQVLVVAKSNMTFFRRYAKTTTSEICELLKKVDWYIRISEKEQEEAVIEFLQNAKKALKYNFNKKLRDYVVNTSTYKSIDTLIRYYTNITKPVDNIITQLNIRVIQYFNLFNENRVRRENQILWLPSKLQQIYDLHLFRGLRNQFSETKLFYDENYSKEERRKQRGSLWKQHKVYIHKLFYKDKMTILNILKGERNVLL